MCSPDPLDQVAHTCTLPTHHKQETPNMSTDPHRQRLASRLARKSWRGKTQILFLIDEQFAESVFAHVWSLDSHGYLESGIGNGRRMRLHRFVWKHAHGTLPKLLDHINGVRWDCRLENLRPATHSLNTRNRRVARKYDLPLGVGLRCGPERYGPRPYRARIRIDGKQKVLGYFSHPADAGAAYADACREVSLLESQFASRSCTHD